MEQITSARNPKVILWRSLKDKRARDEHGLFLVEGRKSVADALRSGYTVEALLLTEAAAEQDSLPGQIPAYLLPESLLHSVCDTRTPQGIAAVVRRHPVKVAGRHLVALDGVQDPGNVGTIIRTADAAGIEGVLLSPACADPWSPKVLRATMGSVFHLPVEVCPSLPEALSRRAADGMAILSGELNATPFDSLPPLPGGYVLVIGSEGSGVSSEVRALATHHITLPMRGQAESLNAAVAAGIMMYALIREG